MTLVDALGLAVPLSFLALMAVEALFPAQALPARRGWRLAGVGFLIVMATIGTVLPLLIPPAWVEAYGLLDLSGLGPVGGFVVGWVLYTLVGYVWHRSAHTFGPMWRGFHQMHHAPTRLDVASSTVFHPTEIVAYTLISIGLNVFVLGLDPVAAAAIGFWGAFVSFLQHANVRTPRWIGPFVQRPESHSLHHAVGGPVGNFADLPLWDMLFGTYMNPDQFEDAVGFDNGGDRRWLAMLAFQDVSGDTGTRPIAEAA